MMGEIHLNNSFPQFTVFGRLNFLPEKSISENILLYPQTFSFSFWKTNILIMRINISLPPFVIKAILLYEFQITYFRRER